MKSLILEGGAHFKYVSKNSKNLIVLIPGWASDERIFKPLNIKSNYLLTSNFSPFRFIENLIKLINKNKIKKISLFGWSMGGFLAADFAAKHKDLVEQLILVSVRRKYPKDSLEAIKTKLRINKKAFLYKFYNQCFYRQEEMKCFNKELFKDYCNTFSLDYLIDTLDFLGNSQIETSLLKEIRTVKIIHGEFDRIAPIKEAKGIKEELANAEFTLLKNTGHNPFLNNDLSKYI
ncbi:MAG: alpha/beta hydrolase [Candidatus Omnitrophica bacterium]|jgi:malonyl-CoA O-methyltransferase|nr:alpha/beta hydrolase [Candidatus Omnitrophota bacterium]